MAKTVKFETYLNEKFLKNLDQAEDYLKYAIESGDLELIQAVAGDLIEAGYTSYTITLIDSIEQASIQLKQQNVEVKI